MAQYDETQMHICGAKSNMINYKGRVFSILYPREQIEEDIEINCKNCEYFGGWNGCQIMRCVNCDVSGNGALMKGVELHAQSIHSASNTYLKGVDWDTIGDKDLEDSHHIESDTNNDVFIIHNIDFKPTKNSIRATDLHSSGSMTDKEMNPSTECADSNLQRFKYKIDRTQLPYKCELYDMSQTVAFYENMDCQYEMLDEEIEEGKYVEQEDGQDDGQDQEEDDEEKQITVFLNEQKWFEMTIKDYQDTDTDEDQVVEEDLVVKEEEEDLVKISVEEDEKDEETQEQTDLRKQTGIFDWPTPTRLRLSEDECGYFGEDFNIKCLDLLGKINR